MNWFDFLILTLAASAVADAWFNGSLFETWHAFLVSRREEATLPPADEETAPSDEVVEKLPLAMRLADRVFPLWLSDLLSCPFCFSHHPPWILALGFYLPSLFLVEPWDTAVKLPLYALAATRLGNLLNRALPEDARIERSKKL